MKYFIIIFIIPLIVIINNCNKKITNGIIPTELRCEYQINPLGIDAMNLRLSWILKSDKRNQKQTAYQVLVANSEENLKNSNGDLWDSGQVPSEQSIHIEYNGKPLNSRTKCYWKVRTWDKDGIISNWSESSFWEMGLLNQEDWKAKWIGYDCPSAPMLRKEFTIDKPIKDARAYICGLGYYELSVNGSRIGENVLDPGQTDYEQRAFYVVYNITKNIKQGANAVGVILGDGWYNQTVVNTARFGWGNVVYGKPRLIIQIYITFNDGTETLIVSDEDWKGSSGPIISNNVYAGEVYDAQLEQPGWDKPNFNDSSWGKVQILDEPGGKLVSQELPPIKRMATLKPVKLTNPKPGVYVYDMGQNYAGWVKLKVKAKKGTTIQLRFAESLFEDGMINPASTGVYATNVVQTERYTCEGTGIEIWEPHFTYHGLQYVEMTGFPGKPSLENLEGIVVYTSVGKTGEFECSDKMLNRIHKTALWTAISNIHSIVTDCPHREKCGWLGDIIAEMLVYNLDVPLLVTKFVRDIETSRRGGIPFDIAPGRRTGGNNPHPDWGSTFIQLPWYFYIYYGDISLARQHYEGMSIFIEHLKKISKNNIIYEGYGDFFSPGSISPTRTPIALTSTAFYYLDVKLMSKMAKVLGKEKDAENYLKLTQEIKSAFNKKFYNAENKTYGSQTGDCVALNFGLVPEGDEPAVAKSMAADVIEKHNGHHSTGHMGSRYIYNELSRYGYGDVAQKMLNQTTYPSIGDLFNRGATTFWEYWGEAEIDSTSNGVRSRNHPFQAGFDAWFYNGIAGIKPDPENPGFKHIILNPQIIGNLTFAEAYYHSIYGLIVSDWRINEGTFQWSVSIPVNTTATVYIPAKNIDNISESGIPVKNAEGVKFLKMENGKAIFIVGSGEYKFIVKM